MLFNTKNGGTPSRIAKTPQKSSRMTPVSSLKMPKKEGMKYQTSQKQKANKESIFKYKTKDSYHILQCLEEIYQQLNFNEYDVFPLQSIEKAKHNIHDLLTYLGDEPICRNHKDLLNLYCDSDKEVVCVACVYKANEHKNHKIKSLESVEKILDLETIRFEEKTKSLIHQLNQLKEEIDFMTKKIQENYMMISKFTINIIDESIKELNAMKVDMQKKLSLAYRRTNTVINRYSEALDNIVNHLDFSMQKTVIMNPLSKHLLLKQLTLEHDLIQELVGKFNENKVLMDQWQRSNQQFEKIVVRKSVSLNKKIDSFVVTEF